MSKRPSPPTNWKEFKETLKYDFNPIRLLKAFLILTITIFITSLIGALIATIFNLSMEAAVILFTIMSFPMAAVIIYLHRKIGFI